MSEQSIDANTEPEVVAINDPEEFERALKSKDLRPVGYHPEESLEDAPSVDAEPTEEELQSNYDFSLRPDCTAFLITSEEIKSGFLNTKRWLKVVASDWALPGSYIWLSGDSSATSLPSPPTYYPPNTVVVRNTHIIAVWRPKEKPDE